MPTCAKAGMPHTSRWSWPSGTRHGAPHAAANRRLGTMSRISVVGPLMLVVGGSLVYHVAAKSVPKVFDPVASVIGVYAAALVASIAVYAAVRPGAVPAITRLFFSTVRRAGLSTLLPEPGLLRSGRCAR